MSNFTALQIPAKDGFLLAAELYVTDISNCKGLIIMHEGTAIPMKLYQPYARFLADQGYHVLCYDYRGVGKSRPKCLKGFEASILDWARLDMVGVIDWAVANYSNTPMYIIAHSMGGQVLGLVENVQHIDKIVTVASSYGNWRNFKGSYKYLTAFFWSVVLPLMTQLYGYFPAHKLGMGADWTKGVAKNWYDWCKGNKPLSQLLDEAEIPHYFRSFQIPMKSFIMTDDFMATAKTIPLFKTDFANTDLAIELIHPSDYHQEKIGHFGFFSERQREGLWKKPLTFFEEG